MKEIRAKITTWLVYSYSDDANIEEIAAEIEAGIHPANFEDFQEVTYKNKKGEKIEFKNYESN